MVNFRYHLVSLVAVFAALAVGVVLGAGPLQARIESAVAPAATEESAVDLDAYDEAQRILAADGEALAELAESRLRGALAGLKVATIALPGASAEDVSAVAVGLENAGAEVVAAASLSDNWQAQSMATYRDTLATPVASHIANLPEDATSEAIIAYGIVATLTQTGAEVDLVKQILSDESTPILLMDAEPSAAAQAIVVVGARDSQQVLADDRAPAVVSQEAWEGLARAVAAAPKSGVIVADAHTSTSMAAVLRSGGAAVTTVDTPGSALSVYATAAALRDASAAARAYGVGNGATQVMPALPDSDSAE